MIQSFTDVSATIDSIIQLYDSAISYLSNAFEQYVSGQLGEENVVAYYPELSVEVTFIGTVDPTISYGFFAEPGVYSTTITRPQLFRNYLHEQLSRIRANHPEVVFSVKPSTSPIPIKFVPAFDNSRLTTPELLSGLTKHFTGIDYTTIDDAIADGDSSFMNSPVKPLSLFPAGRVDLALERLMHYTGTLPENFQSYIIFTNYQMHVDCFCDYARILLESSDHGGYSHFAYPVNQRYSYADVAGKIPTKEQSALHAAQKQMPAYHLIAPDNKGITIINIGVGPSNAKTITDCLAVLRPQCWLMIGHCAGLDSRMRIKDLILANAYYRRDGVLDAYVPTYEPIPNVSEVQIALADAATRVTGSRAQDTKSVVRTGTIMTTADRNWEWQGKEQIFTQLNKSAAIAVDMESATIATNGYRFRIPYGALLSVSDMPLHNQPKLPKDATQFYENTKMDHIMIAITALRSLAHNEKNIHSRKLRRTLGEVAFR